ncbi:HK97 family phage prohead protease [Azospirillum sp. Sh1]|uniref:HK97 family phage prohead protease n=1 Tax=Azospirillum sp. Sh1 TaxID=2607285 RepID=UPI0011F068DF|nr:HK97 family phage prohead protease [Azospirillum sp. Sh1]KAA0576685.1 hypothetical protein FZ029_12525 [Azospirillum sp. Sh1]
MSMQRKAHSGTATTLADLRQVRVICSAPEVDRAGDMVVQSGIDLTAYRTNPVVLWQHDPDRPIARCVEIGVADGKLTALVQFPPAGDDELADLIFNRVKNKVVNAVSIGFMGKDLSALDPANPPRFDANGCNLGGGVKYETCELAELSFVSVPAVRGALVVERSGTVSIDAAELAKLRAAASVPQKLANEFRTMAKTAQKGVKGQILRLANMAERSVEGAVAKAAPPLTAKGLWHIGNLASALSEINWIQGSTASEADWEDDGSAVPGMLADALRQLGAALIAMTQEEVAEMLAELGEQEGDDVAKDAPALTVKDIIGALHGKAIPSLTVKAGRVLSSTNEASLTQARDLIDGVIQQVATEDDDLETRAADLRMLELKTLEFSLA